AAARYRPGTRGAAGPALRRAARDVAQRLAERLGQGFHHRDGPGVVHPGRSHHTHGTDHRVADPVRGRHHAALLHLAPAVLLPDDHPGPGADALPRQHRVDGLLMLTDALH